MLSTLILNAQTFRVCTFDCAVWSSHQRWEETKLSTCFSKASHWSKPQWQLSIKRGGGVKKKERQETPRQTKMDKRWMDTTSDRNIRQIQTKQKKKIKPMLNTNSLSVVLPSSGELAAFTASLSLSRRVLRCFSSRRCFSALASSQWPSSINRWSGRRRLSVGATPSSGSLRVRAKEEK